MNVLRIIRFVCLSLMLGTLSAMAQDARITVHVTDAETGIPVSNAYVSAGFDTNIKPGWGWGAGKPNRETGTTDANGLCVLTGHGNGGSVGVAVRKEEYYGNSGYGITFTNLPGILNGRWEPWNPTIEVQMKKIGNPVPMYAKHFHQKLPVEGVPVGYDLDTGDWVKPHGTGEESDFILRLDNKKWHGKSRRGSDKLLFDLTLTISFSNEGDGIIPYPVPMRGGGSSLRLPREAPQEGYQPSITKRYYRDDPDKPAQSMIDQNQNYFLRVRTQKNEEGTIINALYGKSHGDFTFDHHGEISFTYYLNPTPNDRNLEFDPSRNLFTDLPVAEQVKAP